jgi:hypothetical protein
VSPTTAFARSQNHRNHQSAGKRTNTHQPSKHKADSSHSATTFGS